MSRGYQIIEKKAIGEVRLELPFSLEELLEGIAAEIEELSGEAGLLIMRTCPPKIVLPSVLSYK